MARRRLTRAVLVVALFVVTAGHVMTRLFVLNFSTAGPNATALLGFVFLTGGAVTLGVRPYSRRRDRGLVGLTVVGVAASFHPTPTLSLAGGAVALWALTPLVTAEASRLRDGIGVAVGGGLLVVAAVRAGTGATAPHATTVGRGAVAALTLAVVAVSVRPAPGAFDARNDVPYVAPLAAVGLCAAGWFGAPVASARWAGLPYRPVLVLSVVGLAAGLWAVARGAARSPWSVGVAAAALPVGTGGVLVGGPIAAVGVVLATAALPVLGGTGGRCRTTPFGAALATTGAQGGCLVALFGIVFAVNAAFAPGGSLLRGTAPGFALGLAGIVGVTAVAVAAAARGDETAPERDRGAGATSRARRTVLSGLAVGVVGLLAAQIRAPRAGADPPRTLRVATYNVHRYLDSAGGYSLGSVAALVESRRLGVVGLQETTGTRLTTGHTHGVRWLAGRLGYHHRVAPATSADGYGVALLSAWPLRETRVVSLPRADGARRIALRAVVEHPDGPLPVVVTHLATDGPIRTRQATRVRRLVADTDRAVVLGDFNATPTERPIETMTDAFTDAWAAAGTGPGPTFDAASPSRRIDYVFTRGVRVRSAAVFGTAADSDHRGVAATIDRGDRAERES